MKRSYAQNCALAHALDAVGERWTLLIVRELLTGPKRYGELLDNLAGVGTNLLASRLREMGARGLLAKAAGRYVLTEAGRGLEPVVGALVRFGLSLDIEDDPDRLSRPAWDVVALRALYEPQNDRCIDGRYVLVLNGESFCIEKFAGDFKITRGDCPDPRARVDLSKSTAQALARGELSWREALAGGEVSVSGSALDARRLLEAFGILSR